MKDKDRNVKEGANIVAVIFPQSGGFMARLLPIGIDCYSETLDGLHEEISKVLKNYSDYLNSEEFEDLFEGEAAFAPLREKTPGIKWSYFIEPPGDWVQ